jgi:ATP-dependent exoDNAse (exonuclease V) beta subunit
LSNVRKKPVDHEARQRATTDLDTSFCLEAGAGTGKTTILVERFLSIIRCGRAECSTVAAITFTEKAASEMKDRLFGRIEDLLEGTDLSGEERPRLEKARDDLERAQISTIHAFAAAILREFPLEAGIDPDFQQLDAFDAALFEDECFSEFLGHADRKHEEALRKLMPLGRPAQCIEILRELTFYNYQNRSSLALGGIFDEPLPAGVKADVSRRLDPTAHREYLVSSASRLMDLARANCISHGDAGFDEITAFFEEVQHLGPLEGLPLAARILAVPPPKAKGNQSNWEPAESCKLQKSLCKEIAAVHDEYCAAYMDDLRDALSGWCDDFVDFVEMKKRRGGLLDFDDLLIGVRRLLDDSGALETIRRRYHYILVDEFQDTDPLQAETIMLLAGRPGSSGIDPEPGRLFVVGDPKQSIYRFRRADVEIYELVKEAIAGAGTLLNITQNFRSVPGVIDWVNHAFSSLIKKPDDGRYMPQYEPVHAMREGDGPAVFHLDLETGTVKSDDFRREEGEAVARFIWDLVESGKEVLDPVTRQRRPVMFGDIALIYRSTTGINYYEDPLREADIPYLVEGGKLYYTRQEVRDISNSVWVIEDPFDSAALLAVLRSPMFGFNDEEIFLFRRAGGRLDYLEPEIPEDAEFDAFREAFSLLAGLHAQRNSAGPVSTLSRLLASTGYLSTSKLRVHGDQRVLNLRKAIQTARVFEEKVLSFRHYARWMRDQDILGAAEGESPAIDEGENAVRMITIHKAKGLQFPVVILVNLVQAMRGADKFIPRQGGMPALRIAGRGTSDYPDASLREESMNTAETIRMLYVAATRAGDMLVIPRSPGVARGRPKLYSFLADALADVDTVRLRDLPGLPSGEGPFTVMPKVTPENTAASEAARTRWAVARKDLLESSPPGPVSVSPSGLEQFEVRAGGFDGADRESALLFGTAFHRMMELVLQRHCPSGVEDAAREAVLECGAAGMEEELLALGTKALQSGLMKEAVAAKTLMVEPPFNLPLAGGALDGRIDLLFESDGSWTVVDFKTDDIRPEDVPERLSAYRPQGAAYAWALDSLGISPVGRVVFYFVRPGVEMSIEAGPGLIAEGEGLVMAAVAAGRPSRP